jgi:hypothetical protein
MRGDGLGGVHRGCDLWTFDANGMIIRKDSFWNIRDQ